MATFESFDIAGMARPDIYKLLVSVVMPRPIAWVTSRDTAGTVNAAPYSFFNIASSDPPLVMISVGKAPDRDRKDTLANIVARGEFVVNMVPEELAEAMSLTATNAPSGVDETQVAGLALADCEAVSVPRIADSPVAMECRLFQTIQPGGTSVIVLGRIVRMHIREDVFTNRERLYIDPAALKLVGRMSGAGGYTRTRDIFTIERKEWPIEKS